MEISKFIKKIINISKQIIAFLTKHYLLFLFLILVLSYGQISGMHVWQDDNALFFKLANLQGRAGYLGYGPFGSGVYKYTATFYIPIHKLFGFNTLPYFIYTFLFYFLAAVAIYKVANEILGQRGGKIIAFLFACGFVASDGFIRLFNSVITSISVIFVSAMVLFYWRYLSQRKLKWYILAVIFFFLAVEFARARTHYLISIVFAFELVFLAFEKPIKSVLTSFVRLIAPLFIFYQYFIVGADARSGSVGDFVRSILSGKLYNLYSLTSSFSNLAFPDWIVRQLFLLQSYVGRITSLHLPYVWVGSMIFLFVVFSLLFGRKQRFKLVFFSGLTLIWLFVSRVIFTTPILSLSPERLFVAFWGGALIITLSAFVFFVVPKHKKIYLLFLIWAIVNIAAYAAYQPTVSYETVNRLLAHSFMALIWIFGIIFVSLGRVNKKLRILLSAVIIIWGLSNLISSVVYQNRILRERSIPSAIFYKQLKQFVPKVLKGDAFYFDVADGSRGYFANAFSVAQMPETTAIAWRYGVDRYDIQLFTSFDELNLAIKTGNVEQSRTHTFFYANQILLNTTNTFQNDFRRVLSVANFEPVKYGIVPNASSLEINFNQSVSSVVPVKMKLSFSATPKDFEKVFQNIIHLPAKNKDYNRDFRNLAFDYKRGKEKMAEEFKVSASTQWQERVASNLFDGDPSTIWQADRVIWSQKPQSIVVDMKYNQDISGFVWINGFENNSPTHYSIEVSLDGWKWKEVKSVKQIKRLDSIMPQVVSFDSQKAGFIRMTLKESLNTDSPGIAEIWVVPAEFQNLDIAKAENFLKEPFLFLDSKDSYKDTLIQLGHRGEVEVYWKSNKSPVWQTSEKTNLNVVFDGVARDYLVDLPAGGSRIESVKVVSKQIPANLLLYAVYIDTK